MPTAIPDWYQWHYRPQKIERPTWFRAWPNGGRIAVCLKLMHEWESLPRPSGRASGSIKDYGSLCQREYGFRSGIWRLMDVLDKHQVKTTVMSSGLAVEFWPDSFAALDRQGHEIASHGWDQCVHPPQFASRDEEREAIKKTIAAIEQVIGKRPIGHMSQGPRPTEHTLELIAEEGLIWDADYQDCDFPYVMDVKGHKVVSVGYAKPDFTDADVVPLGLQAGLQQLKDQFSAVYAEASYRPMKFYYAMHVHKVGTPSLAKMLDDFLTFVKNHDGVWFGRCGDIANYWLKNS